jgi:hypothetical protein
VFFPIRERWLPLSSVRWNGPDFLTLRPALYNCYSKAHDFFVRVLEIEDAGIHDVIDELQALSQHNIREGEMSRLLVIYRYLDEACKDGSSLALIKYANSAFYLPSLT